MDWTRTIDGYCERTDPSYWSEPVNAVTNAAFLIAAALCWRMTARDPGARLLVVILALIGIGSYLFHTHAQAWAMLADVLPIQAFILVYICLATVRFFSAPLWAGLTVAVVFVPVSGLVGSGIRALFGPLNGSVGYMPVLLLILAYALTLIRRAPVTARGMAIGSAIFALSLLFRTVDDAVCAGFPLGTHFLWHALNGVMLAWMILVLVRHPQRLNGTTKAPVPQPTRP